MERILKSREKRTVLRLSVHWRDTSGMREAGFTDDLSLNGIRVNAQRVYPPLTRLQISLTLPDGSSHEVKGRVMWSRVSRRTQPGAMGIRIDLATAQLRKYLEGLATADADEDWDLPPPDPPAPREQTPATLAAPKLGPPVEPVVRPVFRVTAPLPPPVASLTVGVEGGHQGPAMTIRRPRPARFRVQLPVRYGYEQPLTLSGTSRDVSANGLSILCVEPLPRGARVLLAMSAGGGEHRCAGSVAWSRPAAGGAGTIVGFRIVNAHESYQRLVASLSAPR